MQLMMIFAYCPIRGWFMKNNFAGLTSIYRGADNFATFTNMNETLFSLWNNNEILKN
jgi:hypothetical protein